MHQLFQSFTKCECEIYIYVASEFVCVLDKYKIGIPHPPLFQLETNNTIRQLIIFSYAI